MRILAHTIYDKEAVIQEIQTEFDKFCESHIKMPLDGSREMTDYEFIDISLKLKSFCNTTSRKIANKYVNKRLLQDIDILNFGLSQYLNNSCKYKGKVYSGQFTFKGLLNPFNFKTYTAHCQISTSKKLSTAKKFLKKETLLRKPCFLIIDLKGFNAIDFSKVSRLNEQEVLIPRGTKFRVDYIKTSNFPTRDDKILNIKQVDNPHYSPITYIHLTELNSKPYNQ